MKNIAARAVLALSLVLLAFALEPTDVQAQCYSCTDVFPGCYSPPLGNGHPHCAGWFNVVEGRWTCSFFGWCD